MKIFLVLHGFSPELRGGTESTVEALARSMLRAGHDVTVIAGSLASGCPDRVESVDHEGLRVLRVHRDDLYFESWFKSHHPGVSRTLARLFCEERPDVVHVHHWLRLTSDIVRLARGMGARTIVTLHDYFSVSAQVTRRFGDEDLEAPPPAHWMTEAEAEEDFALHRRDFADELAAAHVRIAPSRAHAVGVAALGASAGGSGVPGPFEIVPPPALALPTPLDRVPDPKGSRLVTWGSIYPEKGLELLLDAMRAAGGSFRLQVLGTAHDPGYAKEIQNLAKGLDVTFSGEFGPADFAALEADFAVLPSLCLESYGIVMDEAQALGLPVLAADLPAYREHCQEASCAFATPGDPAEWTMLLLDRDRLAQLQRPAPPELQTADNTAARLLGLYASDTPSDWTPDPALERDRAIGFFRRSERRLYATLNSPKVILPPDDFLN